MGLVIGISGTLVVVNSFDNSLNNDCEAIKDSTNIDESGNEVNDVTYTIDDVSEKVYGKDGVPITLILWSDETFSYVNDVSDETYVGRYTVVGDEIHLDYLFAIDRGENKQSSSDDTATITNGTKVLKILSKTDYSESHSVVEIQDGDITLITLNQSAREGGQDFYTELRQYLNNRG